MHLAALAAAAGGLYAAYRAGARAHRRAAGREKVFVLAVGLTFRDAKEFDKWLAAWLPMVEQVKHNEPGTLSYELCVGDADPLKVLVYERYVDRAAYEDVHRSSAAMAAFKQATAGIRVQVVGQSYIETNRGFMVR